MLLKFRNRITVACDEVQRPFDCENPNREFPFCQWWPLAPIDIGYHRNSEAFTDGRAGEYDFEDSPVAMRARYRHASLRECVTDGLQLAVLWECIQFFGQPF